MFDKDIIRDILQRVVNAAQGGAVDDVLAKQIEQQARQDWGGSDLYIAHARADRIAARNEKIQDLWDGGQKDIGLLASRFGLSTKQIRRIVGR